MLSYKKDYRTSSKSPSLKKAQKILKAKIKFENKLASNKLLMNQIKEEKIKKQQSQISRQKQRVRCQSEDNYSSFCKNNFLISNFNKLNREMTSKTHHYKKAISFRSRQKPSEVFFAESIFKIGRTKGQTKESELKSLRKYVKTEGKEELNPNTDLNTRKGFKALTLVSDPKQRTLTLNRVKSVEKQNNQTIRKDKQPEGVTNPFLRRQISKKTIFSNKQQKTYRMVFPMIKEKKIHLR